MKRLLISCAVGPGVCWVLSGRHSCRRLPRHITTTTAIIATITITIITIIVVATGAITTGIAAITKRQRTYRVG